MAVSIPDTLTIETSERYILSIRITPDGFSFSGSIPSKSSSFFYKRITFERSKDYATSLKEAFFEEECLTWSYEKIKIFCFTPNYIFTPDEYYREDKKEELFQYTFFSSSKKTLSTPIDPDSGKLLYEIDPEVYSFLSRSFINPEFIHHMALPLKNWKQQSALSFSGQMYVLLNNKTVDITCFRHGQPIFLNSFDYSTPEDILYFVSCIWKQAELDQLKDHLYIFGNADYKKDLMNNIRQYIHYVSEIELPADVYLRNPEIKQAPYDIILSVCE
ncbi:DUF3822 family protein [Massilibacteroides sp.]|uniref:DUF3822 family protein n=1 Tax=Massilibacteroides sp. TaxID=2034766 RepID=UPI0026162494|nr:DUF3822 family protein [Massilibacteroides sp.]MDD4514224.1 DUF3822 family protein [Massilibacteroides sp.]